LFELRRVGIVFDAGPEAFGRGGVGRIQDEQGSEEGAHDGPSGCETNRRGYRKSGLGESTAAPGRLESASRRRQIMTHTFADQERAMSYHITTTLDVDAAQARQRAVDALSEAGFGVLSEIDVEQTMKKKLDRDMRPYVILGACNPEMAWKALQAEPRIGTMLPCNVIVREVEDGQSEVSAVDPLSSMQAIDNPDLLEIAGEVRARLQRIIDSL
jgi:uncharacterized protein (DUF302 family)